MTEKILASCVILFLTSLLVSVFASLNAGIYEENVFNRIRDWATAVCGLIAMIAAGVALTVVWSS